MPPVVVLDANVLHAAPLRDLFIRLAMAGVVRAHWTDEIHEEWMRSLLLRRPDLSRARLARTRELMDRAVPGAPVLGYDRWVARLSLPDPDDRHVLAAAIQARASRIVTFNTTDFPADELARWKVEARHPDAFLLELLSDDAAGVCEAVRRQRESLRNPPVGRATFLNMLRQVGIPGAVKRMEKDCPGL